MPWLLAPVGPARPEAGSVRQTHLVHTLDPRRFSDRRICGALDVVAWSAARVNALPRHQRVRVYLGYRPRRRSDRHRVLLLIRAPGDTQWRWPVPGRRPGLAAGRLFPRCRGATAYVVTRATRTAPRASALCRQRHRARRGDARARPSSPSADQSSNEFASGHAPSYQCCRREGERRPLTASASA